MIRLVFSIIGAVFTFAMLGVMIYLLILVRRDEP